MAALAANDIWAVGSIVQSKQLPQRLIGHWNGQQWSVVLDANKTDAEELKSVSASSTNDIWIVGFPGLAGHWNGTQWETAHSASASANMQAVEAITSSNVWAVGGVYPDSTGLPYQPVVGHWNGKSWDSIPQPRSLQGVLSGITSSGGRLWAVGLSYSGGYQQVASPLIESNVCP